ncbi:MAG: hypothetical protein UV74_C0013G0161 [Candidatus Woesebacteria bacterium GW2011_GWB1_43_14]|uniref:Type II secretion system protein GspG C-terminal domain-containing protein n=1 Tax=Candidatus Woesebacteria bacterium GW2011_GWB1_43_14 TaxID=1618578 RepID=A0A0G1DH54_9BACT|nr:MAG: hypothetical protein UV51_C0005G0060 [Candidatus Woesebacteria bacterium GW2011_GWC1_42_9]KKS97039.1 MAG: hypothetical protein UV74_C0013G0161 [Candidatus Woesebacteria bacterium GW2011_GWB1_43_14]
MTILGFNKTEQVWVFIILSVLSVTVAVNMRVALRKSRDVQRKADIRSISDALLHYQSEFGFFPLSSSDGDILACKGEVGEDGILEFRACKWGWEELRDIFDESYPPYLKRIPSDPSHDAGARYRYISNGSRFQVYASLEGVDEPEYSEKILLRNLNCGDKICNFGLSFGDTPLDKSIEEYENEMRAKEIEILKKKGLYHE